MTMRSLAEVTLKLLGIYWITVAVASLPSFADYPSAAAAADSPQLRLPWLLMLILSILIYVALGVSLLAYARALATRITQHEPTAQVSLSSQALQSIAFSVLGLYFVATAILFSVQHIFNFSILGHNPETWQIEEVLKREWASIAVTILRLLVGLCLFLGGSALSRFWHRFRPPTPSTNSGGAR